MEQQVNSRTPQSARLQQAPWSGRSLGVGFALAVLLYVISSALGGWLVGLLGWQERPWVGLVLALAQLGLLLPPLYIIARSGNIFTLLGLDRFHPQMLLEVIVALGFSFMGMFSWSVVLLLFGKRAQEPILPLFGEGSASFLVAFSVGAILAPVVEEIVFRGFLFGGLRKYGHPLLAAAVSALLFAVLHFQPFAFPVLFLLGVVLALLYHRTKSLWAPILMHFCINALALTAQYVAIQQNLI